MISKLKKNKTLMIFLLTISVLVIHALILHFMGRIWMCKCGYIKFWEGNSHGSGNSQHISDMYTFSHIIHGMIFYWLLTKFAKKLPLRYRFMIAVLVEVAWEILENSPFIINRYRAATISLDYYGDSIINSVSDVVAMILGFWFAWKFPIWLSIVLILLMEIIVGILIRDNLTLNIIMLIYPFELIKKWQMGG